MSIAELPQTVWPVDPLADPAWRVLSDSDGDLFSSTRWLRVLARGYGLRLEARLFGEPTNPRGGLVWADVNDVRGRRLSSLPFSDFTDPIGTVEEVELARLVSELTLDGSPMTLRLRGVSPPRDSALVERGRLAWHRAELPTSEDDLWSSLRSGARQNVRKAQRNELTVSSGSSAEALGQFRQLHVELRKSKYRMLAQPTRFFDAIASEFGPDDLRVVTAARDGRIIAGVVLLRHGDTAYYKFNASTAEALEVRANDLVMWTAMQEARSWGSSFFDFGVSDLDQPGLIRYKRKYASEEGEVVVLKTDPRMEPTRLAGAVGRLLPALTKTLTDPRCPDRITSRAGDLLYRHFC